jgi:signal transduction histidine kinase
MNSNTNEVGPVAVGGTVTQWQKKKRKVLVIDDSAELRMIIQETLGLFGVDAMIAEDGDSGVQMSREHIPDLIICDINMPGLDGYGTLKAMREHEATATIPFVFLSGSVDRIAIRKGMELGADDYLTKPFTPKELMAAVNARLEKQDEIQRISNQKLDELRGNLTMALPHELRTPLNGIMGLAHLMMEDYREMPPEEVLESARFIHESALRLHRLIENFLVYSQIELMAHESKTLALADGITPVIVQDVMSKQCRTVASKHKREGDLSLVVEDACLLVPAENLTKIVEEIVDNAFKFSKPGQRVGVTAHPVNGEFQLTVSDHGRGMRADQVTKIGPHIQFDRQTYEQQGAGLGLFIAKRITELLGGRIQIESKEGVGTTVTITFAMPGI